jgi:hypothetical protein
VSDDQTTNDNTQDDLPSFTPLPPPVSEGNDEPAAEAATEPGDTHPVFGSDVQPQEIVDEKIVGMDEQVKPIKGEPNVMNFDPENDARIQETLPEE